MKSPLLWICMVILLVIPKPIAAQDASAGWSNGCDSKAQPVIASTTKLDYGKACKTLKACNDAGVDSRVCQMRALMTLQEACTDAQCQIEAQVYAAAITVVDNAYNFDVWNEGKGSAEIQAAIPKALGAFRDRKYDKAADVVLTIPPEIYTHPMLPLIAGLSYAAAGEPDKAMKAYDQAVQSSYLEPLPYYVRGNAFASSGQHEDEAGIDFSLLEQYTGQDDSLKTLVQPLVEAHPFPETLFEDWKAYPVMSGGGGSWTDETLEPTRAVRIAKLDGGRKIATQNLPDLLTYYNDLPKTLVLNAQYEQTYGFSLSYRDDYGEWGASLQLSFRGSIGEVSEFASEFESNASDYAVIAPSQESDPRLKFDAMRCPGAVLSRLKIGGNGYPYFSYTGDEPAMFESVGGKQIGTMDPFADFTVLDGPECHDDQAWWKITTSDGKTGWASENKDHEYHLLLKDFIPIPPFQKGT